MEFTFLGTAAAEGYPGLWCRCPYCQRARQLGGRNLRKTSSVHFADHCLIDMGPDTFSQAEKFGVDLIDTDLLLVTHAHEDHFYPQHLVWRQRALKAAGETPQQRFENGYPRQQDIPALHIFGCECVGKYLKQGLGDLTFEEAALDFTQVVPYRRYECKGVTFIPMTASHIDKDGSFGMIYYVSTRGRSFLYATDSGPYCQETRDCIAGLKVDAVIMEETFGKAQKGKYHQTWDSAMEEIDFFREKGIFKGQPRVFWTHISPHKNPPYDDMVGMLKGTPVTLAYDGLRLDL